MSLSKKLINLCLVLVQSRKTGKCLDMTEKLLTGTQGNNTKQNIVKLFKVLQPFEMLTLYLILQMSIMAAADKKFVIFFLIFLQTRLDISCESSAGNVFLRQIQKLKIMSAANVCLCFQG